jgi:hypothetical protein
MLLFSQLHNHCDVVGIMLAQASGVFPGSRLRTRPSLLHQPAQSTVRATVAYQSAKEAFTSRPPPVDQDLDRCRLWWSSRCYIVTLLEKIRYRLQVSTRAWQGCLNVHVLRQTLRLLSCAFCRGSLLRTQLTGTGTSLGCPMSSCSSLD